MGKITEEIERRHQRVIEVTELEIKRAEHLLGLAEVEVELKKNHLEGTRETLRILKDQIL